MEKLSGLGVAAKLFREKGIFGLYRGIVATAYRDITFAFIYFPMYSYIHDLGPTDPDGNILLSQDNNSFNVKHERNFLQVKQNYTGI